MGVSDRRAKTSASLTGRPIGRGKPRVPNGKTTNLPSNEPPTFAARSACKSAITSGWRCAKSAIGTTRCGPRCTGFPGSRCTSLSPPRPMVLRSMAFTMVRHLPTSAPSTAMRGLPAINKPTSVVVPPMSAMMKSSSPESHCAPTRLAAGPDKTVSIGLWATASAEAKLPSPFINISGQLILSCAMALRTASTKLLTRQTSRAFSTAVCARRGASNASAN